MTNPKPATAPPSLHLTAQPEAARVEDMTPELPRSTPRPSSRPEALKTFKRLLDISSTVPTWMTLGLMLDGHPDSVTLAVLLAVVELLKLLVNWLGEGW